MKKTTLLLVILISSLFAFSQAREEENDGYRKKYSIIITKKGKVKHVIKQGALISSKIDRKVVKGKWYFKAYPDVVVIVSENGKVLGQIELNKELPLRIVTPQKKSGPSIGIGIGPVSVSNLGPGFQNFNMKIYKAEFQERMETKEEKMRRENYAKKEQERLEKEAARKAKKEAKKNK